MRKTLQIALIIAMLMNSVLPPAVSHSHAEGGRTHSHRPADVVQHRSDRHHHHDHSHGTEDESGHSHRRSGVTDAGPRHYKRRLEPPQAHLHFSIVGFDFSLPLPVDSHSNGPIGDDARLVGIVRLTDDFTVVPQVDLASIVDGSVADVLSIDVSADNDAARPQWFNARADRVFLCDTARCKRSGVLLI